MLHKILLSSIILALGLTSTNPVKADSPEVPVSLTVSGGVSLGAYEAGYIYYTLRFLRENKASSSLKLVTGASAGAINGLLSVMATCTSEQTVTPSESLLWKTWMPVGFRELIGTKPFQKSSAVFTNEALNKSAERIEQAWMAGLDKKCDIVLGVATTLLKPAQVKLTDGINAIHPEEPFVIRIQGRGLGKPPLISNYANANDMIPHALLYLPKDDKEKFQSLKSLLLASAAFPGAFPAVKLKLCRTDFYSLNPSTECDEKNSSEEYFVDGGVFDNEPLRLAARIASRGLLKKGNHFQWNESPNLKNRNPPLELKIKTIDVDAKTYPAEVQSIETQEETEKAPLISYLQKFIYRFVISARSQQLYSVLDENPGLEESIESSKNNFPLASEPGLAFAGFFDIGFREYDFYMGMYDARKTVLNAKNYRERTNVLPEILNGDHLDWKKFSCIVATLNYSPDKDKVCGSAEMSNIRKLLQASYDRLYNNCSKLDSKSNMNAYTNSDCIMAMHRESPPIISSDTNIKNWLRKKTEDELMYNLRLLAQNHYHFELMKDPDASPREVMVSFKKDVKNAFNDLAARQPTEDRLLLNFAGEPAFNFISYSPPEREIHVLLGEKVEFGGSLAFNDWLRLHGALTFRRPQDIFSSQNGEFAMAPLVGLEVEGFAGALFQPRLGTRVGYQFTPRDSWGSQTCTAGANCSRLVIEPYFALTIYERVRLQFAEEILPAARQQEAHLNSFIQLGFEFTP